MSSAMPVEAIVIVEMPTVMTEMPVVTMMMAAHPGVGVQHTRIDVEDSDVGGMRGPARAVGHRGRHCKHASRKQRGGDCLQHGRVPPEIARWPVGCPGSSIMRLNLLAAR
jgi:hypothetical protein